MTVFINLCLQGAVYSVAYRSFEDDDMLQLLSRRLVGAVRESTFDVLYSRIAEEWHKQDDVVTPFNGDRRWTLVESVWTFDLDRDTLRLDKDDCKLHVPLVLVRQRPVAISDFESYEPPTLTKHALQSVYSKPYWVRHQETGMQHLQRHRAFVSRILADFAFQWRHVLNGYYNNFTFRKLAYAIIRITTLDFTIREETLIRPSHGGRLVWINNVPGWDNANRDIVRVGGTPIVICQHLPHAITLIREDFAKLVVSTTRSGIVDHSLARTYLVLTVRELIFYDMSTEFERYTEPTRLFDGLHPPPEDAIELLLQACTPTSAPLAPLSTLPVELQDAILDKISAGPIESARVGCLLNLGSVFAWKCGGRNIEREEGRPPRRPWTPVESHIMFGGYSSGVAYK